MPSGNMSLLARSTLALAVLVASIDGCDAAVLGRLGPGERKEDRAAAVIDARGGGRRLLQAKPRTFCDSARVEMIAAAKRQKIPKSFRQISHLDIEHGSSKSYDDTWATKFSSNVRRAAKEGSQLELIIYGDSITEDISEDDVALSIYNSGGLSADAFGISGDEPKNLLYRLQNGEWQPDMAPKLVVIMIGINTVRKAQQSSDEVDYLSAAELSRVSQDIVSDIKQVVAFIHERSCGTRILLHSLLPTSQYIDDEGDWPNAYTPTLAMVNNKIANFARGLDFVYHVDCTSIFLEEDGSDMKEGLMPDWLHPGTEGRHLMAQCVMAEVREVLTTDRFLAAYFDYLDLNKEGGSSSSASSR